MVLIDTWNYFVEGTAISQLRSQDGGSTSLQITASKSQEYKNKSYASATTVSTDLKAGTVSGVTEDDVPSATTTSDANGRRAVGTSMFFSVDDSFLHGGANPVTITIEYLDTGVNVIDLYYDGAGNRNAGGDTYRINVKDSNTGTIKS